MAIIERRSADLRLFSGSNNDKKHGFNLLDSHINFI